MSEIRKLKSRLSGPGWQKTVSYLALIVCPAITFYLFDAYTHNPFTTMEWKTQLLNIVFYELTNLLLFGIFRTLRLALMLQSGLFMLIGLANYYVLNFRSAPIMPWDIYSVSTAASVAGNFNYGLDRDALLVLAGFVILLLLESRIRLKAPKRWALRLLIIFLPLLFLHSYTSTVQSEEFIRSFGLYDKLFTPTVMNKRDGNVVAFMMEMEYLNVEVPEGYSAQEAEALYQKYETRDYLNALAEKEALERPNIIVIMDEAFSDLAVLADVPSNQDYMPFLHSLQEGAQNTVTGYLNVSVLGGNTANTEFEFLTGHTMQFLPQGSVPYQQYLKSEQPSLPSYLRDLGYRTVAMHPYNASGWERNRVYPLLGFGTFWSLKNFWNPDKIRNYVSDDSCVDKIIQTYERKKEGEPLFLFNVTMQNHSGYDEKFENFVPDVFVEGTNSQALTQYLSLLKRTDEALKRLIAYFGEAEEDTLIVFFGDHQPTTYVSNPVLRIHGIDPNALTEEENLSRYQVPYLIWSNFPMDGAVQKDTSVNFLAIDVLEACGLALPPYQNYLKELREEYPVISGMRVTGKDGRTALDSWMTQEEQELVKEDLRPYQMLQYYLLFDYKAEDAEEIYGRVQGRQSEE